MSTGWERKFGVSRPKVIRDRVGRKDLSVETSCATFIGRILRDADESKSICVVQESLQTEESTTRSVGGIEEEAR